MDQRGVAEGGRLGDPGSHDRAHAEEMKQSDEARRRRRQDAEIGHAHRDHCQPRIGGDAERGQQRQKHTGLAQPDGDAQGADRERRRQRADVRNASDQLTHQGDRQPVHARAKPVRYPTRDVEQRARRGHRQEHAESGDAEHQPAELEHA